MRHFSSYGPVDPAEHFFVERREVVEQCVDYLIGDPDKGGHFFTIWAPRQSGKTWIMRQTIKEIRSRHGDRFAVAALSMQGCILRKDDPDEAFLKWAPRLFHVGMGIDLPVPSGWSDWAQLFLREGGLFDRPLILLIDEFDRLPRHIIDHLVVLFRDMYLARDAYTLHGLALVGVRSVLGVDSESGSPFNVQRSLHVPNLTQDEVREMFRQYQEESGQPVDPAVVNDIYDVTRGQPGLVSWFGELLTEKYNPGPPRPILMPDWERTYHAACQVEWNNTVLNLLKKARGPYREQVIELFTEPNLPFSLDDEACSYLYLNGVIDFATIADASGQAVTVRRFSSPFIQKRLYNALTNELIGLRLAVLALEPLDDLADVFVPGGPILPLLLQRYCAYLARLKARGLNPWKDQPRRQDQHFTEAVGHFHLYAWLRDAVGSRCVISPEFPTGNGKVDLLLRWEGNTAVLEAKSFKEMYELPRSREQAARYAKSQGLTEATLALFVPTADETVLQKLSSVEQVQGVKVNTVAIGWV